MTDKTTPFNYRLVAAEHPWLETTKLVLKVCRFLLFCCCFVVFDMVVFLQPDQLVKRRGELGLVKLNMTWEEAQAYMTANAFKELSVQGVVDEVK
jgi:hypothetical protein